MSDGSMIHIVDEPTFDTYILERAPRGPDDPVNPRVLIRNNHLIIEGHLDRDRIVLPGKGIIDGLCLIPIELAAREHIHVLFGAPPYRWWRRLMLRLARWALRRVEPAR